MNSCAFEPNTRIEQMNNFIECIELKIAFHRKQK